MINDEEGKKFEARGKSIHTNPQSRLRLEAPFSALWWWWWSWVRLRISGGLERWWLVSLVFEGGLGGREGVSEEGMGKIRT